MLGVNKYSSNNFSTNVISQNKNQSRVFQSYRAEKGSQTSRTKAYNMNDNQRRIKRNHSALLKQSNQQSSLFEKGLKKVEQNVSSQTNQASRQPIKREYRNKQTYDIMRPVPVVETKFNEGGVRKIYLYDQKKQSNQYRDNSSSRKKFIRECNKESENRDGSCVYLVKKLTGHKNGSSEWHNQVTTVEFTKKQNLVNQQNSKVAEQKKIKSFREGTNNPKNVSQMTAKQGGITFGDSKFDSIDFKQNYYKKYSRLDFQQRNSKSGYLSSRVR